MSSKNTPYYDEDAETMSVSSIPNLEKLTFDILLMLDFIDSPAMVNKSKDEIERIVIAKYQDRILVDIILQLLENRKYALNKLINMFESMQKAVKVNDNKILRQEYEKFGEQQNEEFVYPKFGGKDKFEKTIIDMNNKALAKQEEEKLKKN